MTVYDGKQFFQHRYPTIDVERMIEKIDSFEEFEAFFSNDLMDENLLMGRYLYDLLQKYGTNPTQVAPYVGKSHSYVRKIVNGEELNPARDVLLAICVYIGATVDETQTLLKYAGKQPLYARRKRDAIIWFALKKHQSLVDLDIYLDDHGYKPLQKDPDKNRKTP